MRHPRIAGVVVVLVVLAAAIAVRGLAAGEPAADPGPAAADLNRLPGPPASRVASKHPRETSPSPRAASDSPRAARAREPIPAIPPTSSPVPEPSQPTIAYEAETAVLSPGVGVRPLPTGATVVTNVFFDRTVRFDNVLAEGGGDYTLVVFYVAREPRTARLRVDGGAPVPVAFAATPDDQVGSVTLKVGLLVGLNQLEFGADGPTRAPDLDRIAVR
jgi:hypothetical protein